MLEVANAFKWLDAYELCIELFYYVSKLDVIKLFIIQYLTSLVSEQYISWLLEFGML